MKNGNASPSGSNGASGKSAASQELQNLMSDVEELLKSATSLGSDEIERLREQFGERVAEATAAASMLGTSAYQRARNTVVRTDTYVHQQPWKAIGVGAAAGFLLGVLVSETRTRG